MHASARLFERLFQAMAGGEALRFCCGIYGCGMGPTVECNSPLLRRL